MTVVNPHRDELEQLLRTKKRIAVVGLSNKPERTSNAVAKYMLDQGYDIIPVNPGVDEVFGIKAVASLQDIEGHVDIVNVFRNTEHLMDVAKETAAIDAEVYWAQLGLVDGDAYDYLKERGITVVMDRCIKVQHEQLLG